MEPCYRSFPRKRSMFECVQGGADSAPQVCGRAERSVALTHQPAIHTGKEYLLPTGRVICDARFNVFTPHHSLRTSFRLGTSKSTSEMTEPPAYGRTETGAVRPAEVPE